MKKAQINSFIAKVMTGAILSSGLLALVPKTAAASMVSVDEVDIETVGVTGVPIDIEEAYVDYVSDSALSDEGDIMALEEFLEQFDDNMSDSDVSEIGTASSVEEVPEHTNDLQDKTPSFLLDDLIIDDTDLYPIEGHTANAETELANAYYENYNMFHQEGIDISFETFLDEYENLGRPAISTYMNYYKFLRRADAQTMNTNESQQYYYNTDKSLPRAVSYSRYSLLKTVKKGDIIFEASGGFYFTGHIAIVEGIFYDRSKKQFYIRLIEAIDKGVCRGILDDYRAARKGLKVLRIRSNLINDSKINRAVKFCEKQLGKSYNLDYNHDTNPGEKNWYCSEMIYAAYYHEGIDLSQTYAVPEPGITPAEISGGKNVTKISYNKSGMTFSDISGHYSYDAVKYLTENGIMSGTSSSQFSPNAVSNRAMIVTVLYNLEGRPYVYGNNSFGDVSSGTYYYLPVIWAKSNSITNGTSANTFSPNATVTRQDFVTMLYNHAKKKGYATNYNNSILTTRGFRDINQISNYALPAIKWAVDKGLMNGTTSTTISPKEACTRGQIAVMINMYIKKIM